MKKSILLFCFFIALSLFSVFAQEDDGVSDRLFPEFQNGSVLLKGASSRITAKLNYDLVGERMVYLETENSVMELVADEVVNVTIDDRNFYPSGNGFYLEEVDFDGTQIYVRWRVNRISVGKATGYGGYSTTASVGQVGMIGGALGSSGQAFQLNKDEKFKGVAENAVYLKPNKKFEIISSIKALDKIYKGHKAELENFVKEHKTKFNDVDDVKKIIEYAQSLPKTK
ncbi:MAG: hypothetical protein LBR13_04220 [Dysgonamonadaceae bacterium]|jgi:hypothetical protein|nr:hypothetical protein [Dysgonamonadaceae bacterium]